MGLHEKTLMLLQKKEEQLKFMNLAAEEQQKLQDFKQEIEQLDF